MSQQEANDRFCRGFIDEIFNKYDVNCDNVLDKKEIKFIMQKQMKQKPLRKNLVEREFKTLLQKIDQNTDGQVDKWELYDYCMRNYQQQ